MADNGELKPEEKKEDKPQFEFYVFYNPELKQTGIRTNVKDMVIANGMLEMAKDLFKVQMAQANKPQIQKPGGIFNFARRR